jgi:hypothetical protein
VDIENPIGMDFDLILREHGLNCVVRDGPDGAPFGNQIFEYSGKTLGVQLICDRGQWLVSVKDIVGYPGIWFGLAFLKQIIEGGNYSVLSLTESKEFIKRNWEHILALFSDTNRESTYMQAKVLQKRYFDSITPLWPGPVLRLEAFFQETGLACEIREVGSSAISFKCLQYTGPVIGVRFIQVNGWRVQIVDRRNLPQHWYDIRLIRMLLEQGVKYKTPFAQQVEFVRSNWEPINDLFSPMHAQYAHSELIVLERQYESSSTICLPWPNCAQRNKIG